MSSTGGRLRYLDGLRGIAALIVVFDHFLTGFFPAAVYGNINVFHSAHERLINHTPLYLIAAGNFSVCIFFVLSGIVLSSKFFRTGDNQSVVASAMKRYFRLAIPVLPTVLIAFLLIKLNLFQNVSAGSISGSQWLSSFWQYNPHFFKTLYDGVFGVFTSDLGSANYNPVLWTMRFEFFGSFLVFMSLLIFGKLRRRYIAYAFLGLLFWQSYYLCFIFGMVLADIYYGGHIKESFEAYIWVPLLGLSLLLGSCPMGTTDGTVFAKVQAMMPTLDIPVLSHMLAAMLILLTVLYTPKLQQILNYRPSQFLGRVSFSLYLTHFLIFGTLSCLIFNLLYPAVGYMAAFVIMGTISLALMLVAGYLYAIYIDEPAVRLAGDYYRRMFEDQTPIIPRPSLPEPAMEPLPNIQSVLKL